MTVPVMIHLKGETFIKLEEIARRKGVRMDDMIAAGLDRSVQPAPRFRNGNVLSAADGGGHRRLTAEEWAELDRLRALGYRVRNLAIQFGISSSTIYAHDAQNRKRLKEASR